MADGRCAVPRFFFDLRDNAQVDRDDEGLEFESIEKARDEAARSLAEIAKFVLPGVDVRELTMEVRDDAERPLFRTMLRYEYQAQPPE